MSFVRFEPEKWMEEQDKKSFKNQKESLNALLEKQNFGKKFEEKKKEVEKQEKEAEEKEKEAEKKKVVKLTPKTQQIVYAFQTLHPFEYTKFSSYVSKEQFIKTLKKYDKDGMRFYIARAVTSMITFVLFTDLYNLPEINLEGHYTRNLVCFIKEEVNWIQNIEKEFNLVVVGHLENEKDYHTLKINGTHYDQSMKKISDSDCSKYILEKVWCNQKTGDYNYLSTFIHTLNLTQLSTEEIIDKLRYYCSEKWEQIEGALFSLKPQVLKNEQEYFTYYKKSKLLILYIHINKGNGYNYGYWWIYGISSKGYIAYQHTWSGHDFDRKHCEKFLVGFARKHEYPFFKMVLSGSIVLYEPHDIIY